MNCRLDGAHFNTTVNSLDQLSHDSYTPQTENDEIDNLPKQTQMVIYLHTSYASSGLHLLLCIIIMNLYPA